MELLPTGRVRMRVMRTGCSLNVTACGHTHTHSHTPECVHVFYCFSGLNPLMIR